MAKTYNIGQHMFSGNIEDYSTKITDFAIENKVRENSTNTTIRLTEEGSFFQPGKCYYLYFETLPTSNDRDIFLKYNSTDGLVDDDIVFRKIILKSGYQEKVAYEIIFSPEKICDLIIFQASSANAYVSTTLQLENVEIREVKNLIGNKLGNNGADKTTIIREITLEGNPNIFFVINDSDIKIGPSGYYKIYDDYNISFMGFVFNEHNKDTSFILNYKY